MSFKVEKTKTTEVASQSCTPTPWGPQCNQKHKIITKTKTITALPSSKTIAGSVHGKEQPSWIGQSTRVVTTALPVFVSLYKPFGETFSLATGSLRIICSLQQLLSSIQKGDSSAIPLHLANACVSTFAVAGTLFAHPIGMLVTTGHDMITEILALGRNVQQGNNTKAIENCTHLINDVLYLMVFLSGGSTAATMAYFGTQVLTGAFHSANEIRNGNYIEAAGHTLMSMVRAYQLGDQIHNWYMTRPETPVQATPVAPKQPETPVQTKPETPAVPVAPKQPETPVQAKPVAPVAPVQTPSLADREFKKIPNTAQYKGSNYANFLKAEYGISLDKAFEIAKKDPEIEYFVYNRGGMALEIPSYESGLPRDPAPFTFLTNSWGRLFSSREAVFFKKGHMWLGTTGSADTYVKA